MDPNATIYFLFGSQWTDEKTQSTRVLLLRQASYPHKMNNHNITKISVERHMKVVRNFNRKKVELQEANKALNEKYNNLKGQLEYYHDLAKKLQHQLLNGEVHRGRDSIKKSEYDQNDHANSDIIANFCKKKVFPHHKFLHKSWKTYDPANKTSLYYKCCEEIDIPRQVEADPAEMEYFWLIKTVPMINKKYCKIRANFNAAARGEYFGAFDTCFLS
jgi:hypothetical protein